MKKGWMVALAVIGALLLLVVLPVIGSYNGLVNDREKVRVAVNTLEAQYQRRNDLIPNLVETVKGASNFEKDTLTQVVEARSKATSVQIDPKNVTPEQLQQYQQAQNGVTSALGRLLAVVEAYPDLKASAAYRDLMSQLEGTENRISVARQDYGTVAQGYNAKIQTFPTSIAAALFGFREFPYFTADSKEAPKVNFGTQQPPTTTQPAPAQ